MALGGAILRFGQTGLRVLEFLASAVALGIFSYFLAILADHHLTISTWIRAVEGMSGAAVLYTIFAVILTLCLGGIAFFGFIAVLLDLCFAGCFAAIAYYTRHGASRCRGNVITPIGSGPTNANSPGYGSDGFGFGSGENVTYFPNLGLACRLNTAVFAVSIINIFLFLLTAIVQVLLVRHHKKEKKFGPGPSNGYTKGAGRKPFWKRKEKTHNTHDAEAATALPHSHHGHNDMRPSHETGFTGTTVDNGTYNTEPKYGQPGYGDQIPHATHGTHGTPYHNTTTAGQF